MSAVVRPLVFTDRIAQTREALVAQGLRPRQEAEAGGWIDLAGSGGLIALHSAAGSDDGVPDGTIVLSFEVHDADKAARDLREAGFQDAVVADEAYGREVRVPTPDGLLRIGEVKRDDYGFRAHPAGAAAAVVVVTVPTAAPSRWARLLDALGLEQSDDGISFGDEASGLVRLGAGGRAGASRGTSEVRATVELRRGG